MKRLNTIILIRKEKMEEQRREEERQLKLDELKARIECKENENLNRDLTREFKVCLSVGLNICFGYK